MKIKSQITITLIILILLAVFVYFFIPRKDNEPQVNPTPVEQGIVEVTTTEEETADWQEFNNETLGIRFKYPDNWEMRESEGEECNPYSASTSNCFKIMENESNFALIKLEHVEQNYQKTNYIFEKDYKNSRRIHLSDKVSLLRPSYFNGVEEYADNELIELKWIHEISETPKQSQSGLNYFGLQSTWLVRGKVGYIIAYFIDKDLAQKESDINNLYMVTTMDKIISTLELNMK